MLKMKKESLSRKILTFSDKTMFLEPGGPTHILLSYFLRCPLAVLVKPYKAESTSWKTFLQGQLHDKRISGGTVMVNISMSKCEGQKHIRNHNE